MSSEPIASLSQRFNVTLFQDVKAAQAKTYDLNLDELADRLRNASPQPDKASCPLIKLARFGLSRSDKNSLRHDGNVIEITGVEADYDGGEVPINDAQVMLADAGLSAIIYTSPSHTPARPRWRVLCPTSKPFPPTDRARFVARLNGALGGILAPESFTLSQAFYVGRVCDDYAVAQVNGRYIDEAVDLDAKAVAPQINGESRVARLATTRATDPVIQRLNERGLVLRHRHDGGVDIICPFESEHTTPRAPGECTYWPAHTGGFLTGHFKCLHSHCNARADTEFLGAIGLDRGVYREERQSAAQQNAAPNKSNSESGTIVKLTNGGDLEPEKIDWLSDGWLALGKFHVLAGVPGTGKTTIALAFAATLSCGGRFPAGDRCGPGSVLIWSGEDDPKDTLLPRLLAMGADRKRIFFVSGSEVDGKPVPFDPSRHFEALITAAEGIGDVRLLIVDPIVNAVSGDSHKAAEVRRSLQPVVDLAAKLNAAALGISHFSKGTMGNDPLERVTGSGAFGALPRIVMATAKVRADDESATATHRILVRTKSNIGPDGGGYGYSLEQKELIGYPGIFASYVLWGDPLEGTAKQLLATAEIESDPEQQSQQKSALEWLRDLLTDEPEGLATRELFKLARENGFSERTVYRAKDRLGVAVKTAGFGAGKVSTWTLPNPATNPIPPSIPPISPTSEVGKIGRIDGNEVVF